MAELNRDLLERLALASAGIMLSRHASAVVTAESAGFALAAHVALGLRTDERPTDLAFRQACVAASDEHPYPGWQAPEAERAEWRQRYAATVVARMTSDHP